MRADRVLVSELHRTANLYLDDEHPPDDVRVIPLCAARDA